MRIRFVVFAGLAAILMSANARAAFVTHVPNDGVPTVTKSPAFGTLVSGGEVGTAFIDYGVDYSLGNREGIFDDGGGDEGSFSGVSNSNVLDLLTAVDGRIVVLGSTTQGLTSYLSVEAGFAADNSLLLEAFNEFGALIASAFNGPPNGPHGRTTFSIDRSGVFDIASFRVSTVNGDTFGVQQVTIEGPIAAASPVPEPASILAWGVGIVAVAARRRRSASKSNN